MSLIRTVFLGTPEIAAHCLKSLLNDSHFKVVGVVTQPDRPAGRKMQLKPSPVKQLAVENSIPVLTPVKINQPEILAQIKSWSAEVAVVVAFGQIMGQHFLDLFPRRVVNVHASLLPRWRGAAPIQRALIAGDRETGVSLQVMVKELDAGDVIGERRIMLDDEIDALQLHDAMKPLAADLLRVELMDYLRGNLTPKPQDPQFVTLAPKLANTEMWLDLKRSAHDLHNQVRGLKLGPGSAIKRDGKVFKIHRTQVLPAAGDPGWVLNVGEDFFDLGTGKDALRIFEIQPESKPRMAVKQYMLGHPLKKGDRFEV